MTRPLHGLVNATLGRVGLRVVNAGWGPRGFAASFAKMRRHGLSPGMIVDVGASNGQWTRECMEIFPDSRFFLVDPLEENLNALQAMEASHANLKVWHGALGAREGWLDMHVQGDQSSLLPNDPTSGMPKTLRTVRVPVRRMDSFLDSGEMAAAPALIKADVQGYELEVLRGASRCLALAECVLLEVSFRRLYTGCPLAHEVIAFMGEHGYRIYDICSYAQRPRDAELAQADVLFARDGSKLFEFEGYA